MLSRRQLLAGAGPAGGALLAGGLACHAPGMKKQNFTFCLNTSTIMGQSPGIAREIEIAAAAGYDGIEVWVRSIQDYIKNGGTLADLRKKLQDNGLTAESAIGFAKWIVDDTQVRTEALEQLKREMDMLAQIGCTRIAAPPAGATSGDLLDLDQAAGRYRAILELGRSTGVVPQLELWGFSKNLHKLGQVMYVAVESGHPDACIMPDIYHIYKGGSDFNGLQKINPAAIHIFHINDYPAEPGRAEMTDAHRVYPGDGIAPVPQVLSYFTRANSPMVLSLELFNKEYWQQDALTVAKTGLEKLRQVAEQAYNDHKGQ